MRLTPGFRRTPVHIHSDGNDRWFCYFEVVFEIKRNSLILLLVAAGSLAAAGCGGSDDEKPPPAPAATTDTATSLTKAELIADGDGICAEVNAAVGSISSSTTADEAIKSSQIADIYSGLAERLDGLGTPSDGDAPTQVVQAAKTLADSGASDGGTALEDFQTAATDYGFNDCADAPAAPSSSASGSSTAPSTGSDSGSVPAEPAPAPATPAPAPAPAAPAPPPAGGGVVPSSPPPSSGGGGSSSGGITP